MALYSILAVLNFLPSVFGDEIKDRLMYSSEVKYDYPSKHEWSTRKWASDKYDDDKYYDDDTYRSSKQWQRPKEWKKNDYTKGNVYSHGSYSVYKDEPVKDDWKRFDPKDWKKDDGKYGSKYQPQKYDSKEWKKDDYKPSDWKKGHSYSYKGNYGGSYSMHKDDGKYGSKYSKSDKDKKEYPSKDDDSSKDAEVYGMAYSGGKTGFWKAPVELTPKNQQHRLTCWAACARMLLDLTNKHYETDEEICDIAGVPISETGNGADIGKVMKVVCGGGQCKYKHSAQPLRFTPPSKRGFVGIAQNFMFANDGDRYAILNYIYEKMYLVVTINHHAIIFHSYELKGTGEWVFYGVNPDGPKRIAVTWTHLKNLNAQTLYAVGFPEKNNEL